MKNFINNARLVNLFQQKNYLNNISEILNDKKKKNDDDSDEPSNSLIFENPQINNKKIQQETKKIDECEIEIKIDELEEEKFKKAQFDIS